jgi:hypothetical protein
VLHAFFIGKESLPGSINQAAFLAIISLPIWVQEEKPPALAFLATLFSGWRPAMALQIRRVQVWSGEIPDRPGAAAAILELLVRAGADLEFIFNRPHPHKGETSVIFLAPISGPEQMQAARLANLGPALDVAMLAVDGNNRPGMGFEIMSKLAIAGINLRGLSISALGQRFAAYLAFDNLDIATQALQILATIDG